MFLQEHMTWFLLNYVYVCLFKRTSSSVNYVYKRTSMSVTDTMKKREREYFHSMGSLCKPANMMKLFLKNKKHTRRQE